MNIIFDVLNPLNLKSKMGLQEPNLYEKDLDTVISSTMSPNLIVLDKLALGDQRVQRIKCDDLNEIRENPAA